MWPLTVAALTANRDVYPSTAAFSWASAPTPAGAHVTRLDFGKQSALATPPRERRSGTAAGDLTYVTPCDRCSRPGERIRPPVGAASEEPLAVRGEKILVTVTPPREPRQREPRHRPPGTESFPPTGARMPGPRTWRCPALRISTHRSGGERGWGHRPSQTRGYPRMLGGGRDGAQFGMEQVHVRFMVSRSRSCAMSSPSRSAISGSRAWGMVEASRMASSFHAHSSAVPESRWFLACSAASLTRA